MSVLTLRSARAQTLPPRPPSPPSGPPRGTYFSRRNDAEPSPPLPACTSIFASSMNFMARKQKSPTGLDRAFRVRRTGLGRNHADGISLVLAFDRVLHLPRDARIQRVVAPDADIDAGMHPGTALPDENLPRVYPLAAVGLHAEPFRLGIAPVA